MKRFRRHFSHKVKKDTRRINKKLWKELLKAALNVKVPNLIHKFSEASRSNIFPKTTGKTLRMRRYPCPEKP